MAPIRDCRPRTVKRALYKGLGILSDYERGTSGLAKGVEIQLDMPEWEG